LSKENSGSLLIKNPIKNPPPPSNMGWLWARVWYVSYFLAPKPYS